MVPTVEQCAKAIDLNCEYCCHVIINPKSFSKTSTRNGRTRVEIKTSTMGKF